MSNPDAKPASLGNQIVLALYGTHEAADAAVRKLAGAGVALPAISIVGRNYHTEEQATGYVNAGNRALFYGKFGAFWGGLAGLLVGSGFFFIPVIGQLVVLGPMASIIVGGIEGAVLAGGVSAVVGALSAIGIPRDSVVRYEAAIKSDAFLVTVHCVQSEVAHIKQVLLDAGGRDVQDHLLNATV